MAELNIAIADDNRQTLEMLGEILESEKDYHVVGKADNGNEAYNMIMRTKPDVVLLDIVMPGMDGISVMEKVKSNEEFKENTSFIMVTAASSENLTADAFKLGASYYIMKPFTRDSVLDKLKRLSGYKNKTTMLAGSRKVKPYVNKTDYMEQNLENDVTQMLHEIGIPAHIKGYQYLRDAIIMSVSDKEMLASVTKSCIRRLPKNIRLRQAVWSGQSAMRLKWHGAGVKWTPSMNCSATRSAPERASLPTQNLLP